MESAKALIGKTVMEIRAATAAECQSLGWTPSRYEEPMVAVLSNGARLIASRDPEGNGPGALFALTARNVVVL